MPCSISSITPDSKPVGSAGFVLTASGFGFIRPHLQINPVAIEFDGVEYDLDGSTATSTSVSSRIPAEVLLTPRTVNVRVVQDNGDFSNAVPFVITPAIPSLTSVSPTSAAAGASSVISCIGANFTASSVIRVNGVDVATTFTDSSHIATTAAYAFPTSGDVLTVTVNTPSIGESSGQPITVNNPVPTISAFSPNTKNVGEGDFTLTITGTNYNPASFAAWNGTARPTVFVNSTTLQVSIFQTDLVNAGGPVIGVVNPTPGGGTARNDAAPNITAFSINNPAPNITELSPSTASSGSGAVTITVRGDHFIGGTGATVIKWNGVAQPTTFISASELSFVATQAMLAQGGTALVTAFTGSPVGGTSSTFTFNISSGTPSLDGINPSTVTANTTTSVELTGSGFSSDFTVRLNGFPVSAFWNSPGSISVLLSPAVIPVAGDYAVEVTNNGSTGGTSTTRHFTATNAAPTLSSLSLSTKVVGDAAFTLTLVGSAFIEGSSIGTLDGSPRQTTFVDSAHLQILVSAADLATAGVRAIGVTTSSPGGGNSATLPLTVNNATPVVTSFDSASIVIGSPDTTVTINGTGFSAASQVKIGSTNLATTFVSATKLRAVVPAANLTAIATLTLTVVNPTPGGGTATCPALSVVNPVPNIVNLSPSQVNAGSSAFSLIITGTGFRSGVSSAFINGSARTTVFNSSTQLTMTVNANDITAAATLNITVVNSGPGGGTSAPSPLFVGPVNAVPTVTSVTPSGVNAGDAAPLITIVGTNFLASSVVRWEGADRPTTFIDSTHLKAQLQPADVTIPGTYVVAVFNPPPGGGLSGGSGFIVTAVNQAPVITGLTPASAATGGAAFTLTIDGLQFLASSTVALVDAVGGTYAPAATFVSSTRLTITVPVGAIANAGSLIVKVTNPAPGGGTVQATLPVQAGNPVPALTNVSPLTCVVGAGAVTLTITGTGFVAASQVKANGTNIATTFVSSTSLTATLSSGFTAAVGIVSITVVNPAAGGGTSNAIAFGVLSPINAIPSIDSLSPDQLVRGVAAFVLAIIGKNFIPSSVAALAGTPKTTTYVSPTRVDAAIPSADVALSAGGIARVNPRGHSERVSSNAATVRAFAAGSVEAPAITIGPNATKTGLHSPDEHTWEFVANMVRQLTMGPEGVQTTALTVAGAFAVTNTLGALLIINITSIGAGYASAPTVTIGPPPAGGRQATAIATVDADGGLDKIIVVDPGEGYDHTNPPLITLSGGGGSGGAAVSVVTPGYMAAADGGFFYIPSLNGQPNGEPAAFDGLVPIMYDSLHDKLWIFRGSWRGVALT